MKFRLLATILLFLTLTACSEGITSDKFFQINFYEEEIIPSTTYISQGENAAIEFYAAAPFSGIEVLAAKVDTSDALTVTLYEFDTDYETTIKKGTKVEKATFRNYESHDSLLLSFKTVPKGKYLLTFTTKNNAGICVAADPSMQAKDSVTFYLNGEKYTDGAYYASVIFNGNRLNMDYFKETVKEESEPPVSNEETPGTEETNSENNSDTQEEAPNQELEAEN